MHHISHFGFCRVFLLPIKKNLFWTFTHIRTTVHQKMKREMNKLHLQTTYVASNLLFILQVKFWSFLFFFFFRHGAYAFWTILWKFLTKTKHKNKRQILLAWDAWHSSCCYVLGFVFIRLHGNEMQYVDIINMIDAKFVNIKHQTANREQFQRIFQIPLKLVTLDAQSMGLLNFTLWSRETSFFLSFFVQNFPEPRLKTGTIYWITPGNMSYKVNCRWIGNLRSEYLKICCAEICVCVCLCTMYLHRLTGHKQQRQQINIVLLPIYDLITSRTLRLILNEMCIQFSSTPRSIHQTPVQRNYSDVDVLI